MAEGIKRTVVPAALVSSSGEPDVAALQLEDFLTYRFLILARALDRQAKRVYGESFGLSMVEWRIMAMLGANKTGTVNGLAQNMEYDKAQISRAVASLISQGFLVRTTNANDTRSGILTMTDRGHELHTDLMAFGRERQRNLLSALTPTQRQSFYETMSVLTTHLKSEDAKSGEKKTMKNTIKTTLAGLVIAAIAAATPAYAQKSKDTVTIAFLEATQSVDPLMDGKPENNFLGRAIWDTLITYDETKHQYAPLLAKSWTRVDDTTYEFELRDDVKWTDGQPVTADDVVYTLNWANDPKTALRFRADWSFIDKVEKLGATKVRITTHSPTPHALETIAYRLPIFPKHAHEPLADKETFGTKPVGSSMFMATQVDRNKGVMMVKNPNYKHGGAAKPASNVGHMNILPIPDFGTQTAQFMVGAVNVLRNIPLEQAEEIAKDPRYTMTLAQSLSYVYVSIDAAGRTGTKALTDLRVRKAMMMAVDRDSVYKIRTGTHPLPRGTLDALCWKFQDGCDYTTKPPAYDPAGAKKLLAEAGYADGFDISLATFNSTKDMAEVVAGDLRKVGIRASVDGLTFVAYRQKQSDGKLQSIVSGWSAGGGPDVASTLNFFFDDGPRDYFRDDRLHELAKIGQSTVDETKRKAAMRELFDRATEQAYAIPVAPIPLVFLHTSDLKIGELAYDAFGIRPDDINWK